MNPQNKILAQIKKQIEIISSIIQTSNPSPARDQIEVAVKEGHRNVQLLENVNTHSAAILDVCLSSATDADRLQMLTQNSIHLKSENDNLRQENSRLQREHRGWTELSAEHEKLKEDYTLLSKNAQAFFEAMPTVLVRQFIQSKQQ